MPPDFSRVRRLQGGVNKGSGGAGGAKRSSLGAAAAASPALSSLRQEIMDMGGPDIVSIGWTVGQEAVPAESNTKVGKAKGSARFLSPLVNPPSLDSKTSMPCISMP